MKQRITMRFVRACLEKAGEAGFTSCWRWKDLNEMKTIKEVLAYPDLAWVAYHYARDVIGGRFEIAEPVIAKDAWAAHWYACDVLRDLVPRTWAERYLKGEVK